MRGRGGRERERGRGRGGRSETGGMEAQREGGKSKREEGREGGGTCMYMYMYNNTLSPSQLVLFQLTFTCLQ